MASFLVAHAHGELQGGVFVVVAHARLHDGTLAGQAELRVPAVAVGPAVVGQAEADHVCDALLVAARAMAIANARAAGHR